MKIVKSTGSIKTFFESNVPTLIEVNGWDTLTKELLGNYEFNIGDLSGRVVLFKIEEFMFVYAINGLKIGVVNLIIQEAISTLDLEHANIRTMQTKLDISFEELLIDWYKQIGRKSLRAPSLEAFEYIGKKINGAGEVYKIVSTSTKIDELIHDFYMKKCPNIRCDVTNVTKALEDMTIDSVIDMLKESLKNGVRSEEGRKVGEELLAKAEFVKGLSAIRDLDTSDMSKSLEEIKDILKELVK